MKTKEKDYEKSITFGIILYETVLDFGEIPTKVRDNMEEHPLITHYKEQKLIDDRILFFIGKQELFSAKGMGIIYKTMMDPFQSIHAIGIEADTLRIFHMKYNHLTDIIKEIPLKEIVSFVAEKKFLGKIIVKITTQDQYYEYKVTANKDRMFQMQSLIMEEMKEKALPTMDETTQEGE